MSADHSCGRETASCPSSLCEEDALLLGVVGADGTVGYVQPPTRVSADFVRQAQARGHPERWFRFSSPCRQAACPQWTGAGCGVIDVVIGSKPLDAPAPTRLPACGIRRSCQWFAQHGADACAVCPLIIADTGGTGTYQSTRLASGAATPAVPGCVGPDGVGGAAAE
jgi:hypothetical protein